MLTEKLLLISTGFFLLFAIIHRTISNSTGVEEDVFLLLAFISFMVCIFLFIFILTSLLKFKETKGKK